MGNNIPTLDNTIPEGEVCKDEKAYRDKQKVLAKQRISSFFYSISDTAGLIGGLLLPAGLGIVGSALTGVTTFGGAMAAIAAAPTVGLTFLAIAVASLTVSVGAKFCASRYGANANFDQAEVNALHTARYVRKELESKGLCITHKKEHTPMEYPQNLPPSDGRTWLQVSGKDPAQVRVQVQQALAGATVNGP